MVAGFKTEIGKRGDERRDFSEPGVVGEPYVAIDDRQRMRIARDAAEKAGAEVKHATAPCAIAPPQQAPLSRSLRSRCSGTDGRKATRGSVARSGPGARAAGRRATSECRACRSRIAAHSSRGKLPAAVITGPAPVPGLR